MGTRLCVLLFLFTWHSTESSDACDESDAKLQELRFIICDSLTQSPTDWCGTSYLNVSRASKDWPSQAVYMNALVTTLQDPATCLNTTYAQDTVNWLDTSQADPDVSGSFAWTYLDFQVQYYDMPRQPGARIESPPTLGRKCWAFAFLKQMWNAATLSTALAAAGLTADNFIDMYDEAIPLTMDCCWNVMANCFVNASYDPSRNGTCPGAIDEFHYLGFDRENVKRRGVVDYPFF